jgi:hypothetical protein
VPNSVISNDPIHPRSPSARQPRRLDASPPDETLTDETPLNIARSPLSQTEALISAAMLENSKMFLRKAAVEIAAQNSEEALDLDGATLAAVLIQTAVELAASALVIRHDGLAGLMKKDVPLSEAETETRWRAGTIRTLPFDEIKKRAKSLFGNDDLWSMIDTFQALRNKLVHFHQPLFDGDLVDLTYDATHILIQMIVTISDIDHDELAEGSKTFLGEELFEKLLSSDAYAYRVQRIAGEIDHHSLCCIMCNLRAYSRDLEKCIACGYDGELKFIDCPSCDEIALLYDHLNLPLNETMEALCGACGKRAVAARCTICENDYGVAVGAEVECPWIGHHEL